MPKKVTVALATLWLIVALLHLSLVDAQGPTKVATLKVDGMT